MDLWRWTKSLRIFVSYQYALAKVIDRGGTQQQVVKSTHLLGVCQFQPPQVLSDDSISRGRDGYYAWPNYVGFCSPRMIQLNAAG